MHHEWAIRTATGMPASLARRPATVCVAHAISVQLSGAGGPERAHRGARLPSSAMSLDFPAFEPTEEHRELRAVVRALAGTNQSQRVVMARQLLK